MFTYCIRVICDRRAFMEENMIVLISKSDFWMEHIDNSYNKGQFTKQHYTMCCVALPLH